MGDGAWYHTIVFPDGTVTPGVFDTRGVAGLVQWPSGLAGGRCLDVGTCDGFWAFEMEQRGAEEIVAIDVDGPDVRDWPSRLPQPDWEASCAGGALRGQRFELARRALGSRAKRLACSVYDLDPALHGRFDVVFSGTLLPHLRDPIRALERMREVCAGELVLVECTDALLDLLARRIPCARVAPATRQWWRVNQAGLLHALGVAGFEVVWVSRRFFTPFGSGAPRGGLRLSALAVAGGIAGRILRAFPGAPLLADLAGLAHGTLDIAVRARPRPRHK